MAKSFLFTATLALTTFLASASTKVSVIELGKGGTVRRTTSKSTRASIDGVVSFWDALHATGGRKLQTAGMTVVPDLFNKPESSVVIGLSGSGVDIEKMPSVASLLDESHSSVVGHFEVEGKRANDLLSHVNKVDDVTSPMLSAAKTHAGVEGVSGMKMSLDTSVVEQVDAELDSVLREIDEMAKASGTTVIVHLVVEENVDTPSTHRRLEEADGENNANEENDGQQNNGMYGYGYYVGDTWVTPYKTIFQIQYFNVVLWTSLGLVLVAISAIYMMMFMPLEPDTLLFGESAKIVE